MQTRAYWTTGPGRGELRRERVPAPREGYARVRALRSGVSRGTETLVHRGGVPADVADLMRAPHQQGDFPWPVKYGYLSVGVIEAGPSERIGERVFCLYPHQERYTVPVTALTPVPPGVPADRAVLAGTVETALNAIWDAGPHYGDRVAVVGLGMVGACVAALLRDFPLARLQAVDVDPARAQLCAQLGVEQVSPEVAADDCDVVLHCSASEAGLNTALSLAGEDADVIEVSWFGDRRPQVPLGADFHARRLRLRASQVGAISLARRHRRSHADRMALALQALQDPRFDALLGPGCEFDDLPAFMSAVVGHRVPGLCQVIRYPDPNQPATSTPNREDH